MKSWQHRRVNGAVVCVPEGTTVYEACRKMALGSYTPEGSAEAGFSMREERREEMELPHFCYHERRSVVGNCRMCRVEVEGGPKPVAGCTRPVTNGRKVVTSSPRVSKAREGVMEMLLRNHPLDCPICDQGGECDLQDQSYEYGSDRSRGRERKRVVEDKERGPIVKTVMTRCIHCTRCVRYVGEVGGAGERGMRGRGNESEIGRYVSNTGRDRATAGNRVDLCPVGALTGKVYAFEARPWELKSIESIDVLDGVGATRRYEGRGGAASHVKRVRPVRSDDTTGEWRADTTRYAYDGRRYGRILKAYGTSVVNGANQGVGTLTEGEREKRRESAGLEKMDVVVGPSTDAELVGRLEKAQREGKVRSVSFRGIGKRAKRRRTEGEMGVREGLTSIKGRKGRVVGVDMVHEVSARARRLREGELETSVEGLWSMGRSDDSKRGVGHGSSGRLMGSRVDVKEGQSEISVDVLKGKTLVGGSRWTREDGNGWIRRMNAGYQGLNQVLGKRGAIGGLNVGVEFRHHQSNTYAGLSYGLEGVDTLTENAANAGEAKATRGMVQVDQADRLENGVGRATSERSLNSHGTHACQANQIRPLRTAAEVTQSRVNTTGVVQETKGWLRSDLDWHMESMGDGEDAAEKARETRTTERKGVEYGWKTRSMKNLYDPYVEGHTIRRASVVLSEVSRKQASVEVNLRDA